MLKRGIYILTILLFTFSGCDKNSLLDGPSGEFYSIDGVAGTNGNESPDNNYEPGTMTAGEWNDLDNWEFWKNLMQENDWYEMQSYWGFFTSERYSFILINSSGEPVINAILRLKDTSGETIWQSKSDNKGKAELWGNLFDYNGEAGQVIIVYNDHESVINPFILFDDGLNVVNLPIQSTVPETINIQFVVDATGSMGDEINYLKAELGDVIEKVKNQFTNTDLLMSLVFYRDEGDDFVVDKKSFTSEINSVLSFVNGHNAAGGGDYPEAVETALSSAIEEQWSEVALTRIMFLILDAPPHYNQSITESLHTSIKSASAKGIKIIPVAASGVDKNTEFLLRFFAISTNGTYTFITDHSGIGNDHLEPTIGEYEIELLNDLIIRLITESAVN